MDSQLFEIHTLLLSQGAKKYKIFVRHVNKKFYICVEKKL
jgi:L-rhamnose mutarotase